MAYRREIDGVRALAVLPVILFHAGFNWFSGGFVGVDVFFVISGYLITGIIVSDLEQGKFSFAEFYERRARRILPALYLVVLVCFPFAWLWMMPEQLSAFARSVIAVTTFVSNILFWTETTYFGAAAELKPLLHTWSLATEEQFYILFPILLAVLWKIRRSKIIALLLLVALASLLIAQFGKNISREFPFIDENFLLFNQPSWASFYLLTGRFWELLLGAMAALAPLRAPKGALVTEAGAAAGVGMVIFSIVVFDKSTPFPSVYTLVPVVGTYLIISFATEKTVVGKILSWSPLVGIGLISYSAYLWHQPLFAYLRIRSAEEPAAWHYLMLSVVALILAYLTWRYVEKPFRNRSWLTRGQVFGLSIGASILLVATSLWVLSQQGALSRFSKDQQSLLVKFETTDYQVRGFNNLSGKKLESSERILIVGDSFAQDFVNIAIENGYLDKMDVSTYYIPNICGVVTSVEANVNDFVSDSARGRCVKHLKFESPEFLANLKAAKVVFLASNWLNWQINFIPETLELLSAQTNAKLIVIGGKRFEPPRYWRYLNLTPEERAKHTAVLPSGFISANDRIRAAVPKASFIDAHAAFCNADNRCRIFTPNGDPISNDGSHLTPEGARFYGQIVIRNTQLHKLLGQRTNTPSPMVLQKPSDPEPF